MSRNRLSETPTQATLSMPEIRFYSGSTYEPYKWQSNNRDLQVVQLLEQRSKEAADAKTAYNTQLSQLKNALNPAESEWIREKEQEIDNTISAYIQSNDYAGLRNYVTQAPSQLLKSNEYLNRVKAQEKYLEAQKTVQDKLNKGEIDNITYQRWNKENQYSYQDEFDANGNVVLSIPWSASWTPVKKIDWTNIVNSAFKNVTPSAYRQTTDNVSKTPGLAVGSKVNSGYSYQKVELKDIIENLREIATTDEYDAMHQDFEDRVFEYNEINKKLSSPSLNISDRTYLTKRLSELKKLLCNNGSINPSFDSYLSKQVENNLIASNLAYNNIGTYSEIVTPLKNSDPTSSNAGNGNNQYNPNYIENPAVPGMPGAIGGNSKGTNAALNDARNNRKQATGTK